MRTPRTSTEGKKGGLRHKIAAAMTAGMLVASEEACAQAGARNVSNITSGLVESTASFTDAISLGSYIMGCMLTVTGVWKLKQHVDGPIQFPMKDGLIRLASGGMLLSLPYMSRIVTGSVGDDGAGFGVTPTSLARFGQAALPMCDPSAFSGDGVAACNAYFPSGWSPP